MGTSASSLLHRRPVRRHGYKSLPDRHDEEEKQEKHEEFIFFEEERQGPAALEARGAMLRDRARRREGTVFDTGKDLRESALCYLVALNWGKAGLAFAEQAMYGLELGDGPGAATALLRSAKCYVEMEHMSQNNVAFVERALEEATALFVKAGDLELAAVSCLELAEFYMDRQDLGSALDLYEQAAEYCRRMGGGHLEGWRQCTYKAKVVRNLLHNEDALRLQGVLPVEDYKRKSAGYIRLSDPDWRLRVSELYLSTTHPVVGRPVV
ncbi:uncharacterized protein [Lolium perenne]|uniref:uncharacterized protein n=1 Tax=Lolium perenne TaxID=4522 RepID=UPI0021EA0453|nr:uncharacterized protein LOC127348821 [Lolium perenne]